jgi:DNA mismatch repair protein MutS
MTGTFVQEEGLLRSVQEELRSVSDVERIATRIALRAATPRELAALRDSLSHGAAIGGRLKGASAFSGLVARCVLDRDSVPAALASEGVTAHLERWLVDSPAATIGDGAEVIRGGQDEELDRYRALEKNGHGVLAQLESAVRARTGISSLKVKFNNQLGYFFEVGKSHAEKLTSDEFQRRQSTTSGERFFTAELKSLEQELFSASGKARAREQALFSELLERLVPLVSALRGIAQAVSEVDLFASLAQLARERGWVKPEVLPTRIDQRNELLIESGRHPILEEVLTDRFIPNTVMIDEDRQALIVTGPNMGGKSTYLRQIAQLVILAQIGSFVPAARMRMTVVDGVFARLGASDNLAEGDSTFMVEMRETALICAAATANSLVVIDEIGRGTATADGRALAQAILEWLVVQVKARVLFATHFHELTALASVYPTIHNVSVGAVERDGVVHFTHSIVDGPANRSYGIEVASHAGLPGALLARARELLNGQLVGGDREAPSPAANQSPGAKQMQLSIFEPIGLGNLGMTGARSVSGDMASSTKTAILHSGVIKRVQELSISELTPLQALTILDELQRNLHE